MDIAKTYDVLIIGGGIGGLMTAYKLKKNQPSIEVCLMEKGNSIDKRVCLATNGNTCKHCKTCSITSGMSGAGAFSDGKLNLGTAYGGILGEELGEQIAMQYIKQVDNILLSCSNKGAGEYDYPQIYSSNRELKTECLRNNLTLLDMDVRHLGTERNLFIMSNLIKKIEEMGVSIVTCCEVREIGYSSVLNYDYKDYPYEVSYHCSDSEGTILTKNIVIATGRSGADYVSEVCQKLNVETTSNTVDIGVRVEMKDAIWRHFSQKIYEPKILYKTKTFEDKTRCFCFNQGGIVSAESNDGIITANGHSFSNPKLKTENCNFAILSSINFTQPFNKPTEYCKKIAYLSNAIGNGNVIVQRYGDLIRGRRTNERRLSQNTVRPTLKATAGDLSLVLPHRILTNIIETIQALDKVAKGSANDDTLLYGVEAKYYSVKPKTDKNFQIVKGIYVCGDCSGRCRGLSQSGAMGLYIADNISNSME